MIKYLLLSSFLFAQFIPAGPRAPVGGGTGTVAFDNSSTCTASCSGLVSSASTSLTIGSGVTNGAVIVVLHLTTAITGFACTLGGVNMPEIDDESSGISILTVVFGLATGSTTGAQTIACSWTTPSKVIIGAVSFKNVNQTTPFPNVNDNSGTLTATAPVTVTSATNDAVFVALTSGDAASSIGTADGTLIYAVNDASTAFEGGTERFAGAASVATAWPLLGTAARWSVIGVDIAHL